MTLETTFSERLRERLKQLDTDGRATVNSFRLQDFSQYRYAAGYCQALADVETVMNEILEDLQTAKTGE